MDQRQTVHNHYQTYWIYLLLTVSILKLLLLNFTHQWFSKRLANYLGSIFAMQVKSVHIIQNILQKVSSENHISKHNRKTNNISYGN